MKIDNSIIKQVLTLLLFNDNLPTTKVTLGYAMQIRALNYQTKNMIQNYDTLADLQEVAQGASRLADSTTKSQLQPYEGHFTQMTLTVLFSAQRAIERISGMQFNDEDDIYEQTCDMLTHSISKDELSLEDLISVLNASQIILGEYIADDNYAELHDAGDGCYIVYVKKPKVQYIIPIQDVVWSILDGDTDYNSCIRIVEPIGEAAPAEPATPQVNSIIHLNQ